MTTAHLHLTRTLLEINYEENNPELYKEINKLPFKSWHKTFIAILQKFPLSSGKKKAILKNENPKVTFGILSNHFMGLARKFGIPQVYIQGVETERWLNHNVNRHHEQGDGYGLWEEERIKKAKYDLNTKTFDLVIAVYEKVCENVRGRNSLN